MPVRICLGINLVINSDIFAVRVINQMRELMSELRYSRQEIFAGLGRDGQEKLGASSVAVAGCGALGSTSSALLVRAGVGRLRIIDRDYVEIENLQRQTLFTEAHAMQRYPKALAAAEVLRGFNADVKIEAEVADINAETAEEMLGGFDLVVDALDNMETRFVVNDYCLKNGLPWIYGAAVGSTGTVMSIGPGGKPCLRCLIPELPPPGSFGTCDTMGVVGPGPSVTASIQAAEAIKNLAGRPEVSHSLLIFDLWDRTFDQVDIKPGEDCPACARGEFEFLESKGVVRATRLCGRDSVEIIPEKKVALDLKKMEETLSRMGGVQYNGYSLWFKPDELEMVIFPDSRALVKGTVDKVEAETAYAKFISI